MHRCPRRARFQLVDRRPRCALSGPMAHGGRPVLASSAADRILYMWTPQAHATRVDQVRTEVRLNSNEAATGGSYLFLSSPREEMASEEGQIPTQCGAWRGGY